MNPEDLIATFKNGLPEELQEFFRDMNSKDALEMLDSIGFEGAGLGGISLRGAGSKSAAQPQPSNATLESFLERMNADQIKCVALRFDPKQKNGKASENKKIILAALDDQNALRSMVAKLAPIELRALQIVKNTNGTIYGWELLLSLALHGFEPPAFVKTDTSVYRARLLGSPAVSMIASLLRDGLLLPNSPDASWFEIPWRFHGSHDPTLDLVFVDPRILANIPETSFDIPPLSLPAVSLPATTTPVQATHPAKLLLEFIAALHAVFDEGGVALTKDDDFSKQSINRIVKQHPLLAARLEDYLDIMLGFGVLRQNKERQAQPVPAAVLGLHRLPPYELYEELVTHLLVFEKPKPSKRGFSYQVVSTSLAKSALLLGLRLLPDHAVPLDAFMAALEQRLLRYVLRQALGGRHTLSKDFAETLCQEFAFLGLVGVTNTQPIKIVRGTGMNWILQKSATPSTSGALLVQPNFEVLVYLDQLQDFSALIACDCKTLGEQTATYGINRQSVYRALQLGLDSATIIKALQDNSVMPLPSNVAQSIKDWAERRERIRVSLNTTLLEYHNQNERDTALKKDTNARAIGTHFLLTTSKAHCDTRHRYDHAPEHSIVFKPDGSFRVQGALDLATRAIVAQISEAKNQGFVFSERAIRQGLFAQTSKDMFFARVKGDIPAHIHALLEVWSGHVGVPNVGQVEIFQHPLAQALKTHPDIDACLAAALNETTHLVKPEMAETLRDVLVKLGVPAQQQIRIDANAGKPSAMPNTRTLERNLPTRTMREMIERAIGQRQAITIEYHVEKIVQSRYGYPEKRLGKLVTERIKPTTIDYQGSTPYFLGLLEDKKDKRQVRIGYIRGIAVG